MADWHERNWHGKVPPFPRRPLNLSSEVRLNVDLDVTLIVIANSCYRWLASKLKGFEDAKPKQLSRKFFETSGEIVNSKRLAEIGV